MADIKKSKPVQTDVNLETATIGSVPSTGADGVPSVIHGSQSGILFVTVTNDTGSASISIVNDNSPAGTPAGVFIEGVYRATLPTYADGDAVVPHFDERGKLLTSNGTTYQATLPTYADGDPADFQTDANGRLLTRNPSSTPSVTSVAGDTSNQTLLAANANRLGAIIYNDSTANLYLKLGTTASTTSFTALLTSDSYYEVPFNYTGRIDGVWASATGDARITELTA